MKKVYVGDLEADNLLEDATKIHCGVFSSLDGKDVKFFGPDELDSMIAFLETCDVLIFHNGIGYDFPLMEKILGYSYKGTKVDSLLMSRLLNPNRVLPPNAEDRSAGPHSLKSWGYRVGISKPDHEDWSVFSPEMKHRCIEDVKINVLTYHALLKEAKESGGGWGNAFKLTFKLFENLQKQEQYGWRFDTPYATRVVEQLERMVARIDKLIDDQIPVILEVDETKLKGEYAWVKKPFLKSGNYSESVETWYERTQLSRDDVQVWGPYTRVSTRKLNLNSLDETKDYLLELGWVPEEWNFSKKTGEKTSPKIGQDEEFEGLDTGVGRFLAKRFQCRHRISNIQGLINIVRPDGRISASIASLAVTGRAKHRGIVNIPGGDSFMGKQMRKMFIASEGKVLVSADSSSNQLRQLAARMGDDSYKHTVIYGSKEKGDDVYSVNAKLAGLKSRAQGKTFTLGVLFGSGDAKTGKIVGGSTKEGKKLKENYYKALPAVKRLLDDLNKEWDKTAKTKFNPKFNRMEKYGGWIRGLDGRPIHIDSNHKLLVFMLQSDEAIQMSAAYNMMWKRLSRRFEYGVQFGVVCFYHDEYTVECDPEIAEEVKQIMEDCIRDAGEFFKIDCPHKGEGKIGNNWWDVH